MSRGYRKDLTGQKFGRLTVARFAGKDKGGRSLWEVKCECGNIKIVVGANLIVGQTKSCGCLSKELSKELHKTHGMSKSTIYATYNRMLTRCNNENHMRYNYYGGRGIKVCERWKSFENFYADMGGPPNLNSTIDRIDSDGDYCPENCRWASWTEQANNRRNNNLITYEKVTKTMKEWATERGIPYRTLWARLMKYNWDVEAALNTPVRGRD